MKKFPNFSYPDFMKVISSDFYNFVVEKLGPDFIVEINPSNPFSLAIQHGPTSLIFALKWLFESSQINFNFFGLEEIIWQPEDAAHIVSSLRDRNLAVFNQVGDTPLGSRLWSNKNSSTKIIILPSNVELNYSTDKGHRFNCAPFNIFTFISYNTQTLKKVEVTTQLLQEVKNLCQTGQTNKGSWDFKPYIPFFNPNCEIH